MFERLTDRLNDTFRNLAGRGVLSEKNITDALREVRRALLEADVSYQVVKDFVAVVKDECLGEKVLKSVTPGQQAIKIVSDHLVELLGESNVPLDLGASPAVVMLVGLHGSGKTTTCAKLARHLSTKQGRQVMLAACDLHRPAAIDQLEILGRELGVTVHSDREARDVAQLAVDACRRAEAEGADVLILDTAGRHQIDDELVRELVEVRRRAQPREVLLVADAALGQEAVSVAEHFDKALGLSGIVLTKLDGDARGGAALSMRQVTGKPIKFIGVGEGMTDLEPFFPQRLASRILGMGDVVGLVEKAAEHIEVEEAEMLQEKLRKQTFDFDDFLSQLRRLKKMGGILSLLDLLPGMGKLKGQVDVDDRDFARIEGIICSMTPHERHNPDAISMSRRQRIARGSGATVVEISQLMKQFEMMRKVMGTMGQAGLGGAMAGLQGALGGGGPAAMQGMGMPAMGGPRRGTNFTKPKKKRRNKRNRR